MNRSILLALALAASPAWGALTFVTSPADGSISGLPGSTIGWGFTFTSDDSNNYLINLVEFCRPSCASVIPGVGTFNDYASPNLVTIGPLGSPSPYTEAFVNGVSGLGSFVIDVGASLQSIPGTIRVHFDVYDATLTTQLSAGQIIFQSAQVNIGTGPVPVPEPASLALALSALAAIAVWRVAAQKSSRLTEKKTA